MLYDYFFFDVLELKIESDIESSEGEDQESNQEEDNYSSDSSLDTNFESCDESDNDKESSDSSESESILLEDNKSTTNYIEEDSEDDDIIIENETIIYNNSSNQILDNLMKLPQNQIDVFDCDTAAVVKHQKSDLSSNEDFVIENEEILFQTDGRKEENIEKLIKMKYKKRYTKVDPNLIIKFSIEYQDMMKSLKILFDWLYINQDILIGCYKSNPEFIHKIMKLINFLNIDIFTRKIFFERSMILTKNVRKDLRHLFDIRHQIAVEEDCEFKKFLLFEETQKHIEWDYNYKLNISEEENVILRNFKIIDFGFFICKMKKFNYNFCARTRVFVEKTRRRRDRKIGNVHSNPGSRRRRNRDKRSVRTGKTDINFSTSHDASQNNSNNYRKGYMKNKREMEQLNQTNDKENNNNNVVTNVANKNELMGKLWLRSEIHSLEMKVDMLRIFFF